MIDISEENNRFRYKKYNKPIGVKTPHLKTFHPVQLAFSAAIGCGRMTDTPVSINYVGHYTYRGNLRFEHNETGEILDLVKYIDGLED